MRGSGRISLLVDGSPLATLAHVMSGLEREVKKEINAATKKAALPIWSEGTHAHAQTRLQVRLADSSRVGVTADNVFLRAGNVGVLSSGTPIDTLAEPIEFGANPERPVATRSRKGTEYKRRLGGAFRTPMRGGRVVFPASRDSISRVARLWIQTTLRTMHEQLDAAGNG